MYSQLWEALVDDVREEVELESVQPCVIDLRGQGLVLPLARSSYQVQRK